MPEIVYNVKFRIKQEQVGKQGVADITRYEQTIEKLKNTINKQAAAAGTAEKATKQYTMSMKGVTQVQGNANKQVAIGNQLFFSMSDGIQDSAQFSQGFAQGMRAVGNNIGFTAELMGSFIQRTKEMNNGVLSGTAVMAGLRQSFLGVGGIIFALNTTITLLTVFGDKLFGSGKEAKEAAKEILDYEKALTSAISALGAFKDDVLGFEQTSFILQLVSERLARATESFFTDEDAKRLRNLQAEQQSLNVVIGSQAEQATRDRKAQLQVEIDILTEKKNQSATQEDINALTDEQNRLAKELGVSLSVINSDTYQAYLQQKQTLEDIKAIEESRLRTQELANAARLLFEEGMQDYRDRELESQRRLAQIEEQRRRDQINHMILLQRMPKPEDDEIDESAGLRRALQLEQDIRDSKLQTAKAVTEAALSQFLSNKQMAIATTLMDTYLSAQKAYASQLIPGDPTSLARAQTAAALAVVQGLARVAIIRATQLDGGGGGAGASGKGGGAAQSRFGFQMNRIEGEQTFRAPAYTPRASSMKMPETKVEIMADRKQLYYIVKQGEEEYRQIKA